MKQKIYNVLVIVFTFFTTGIYAQQQQVSSLLSNYGLGTVFSESTVAQKGQGDLSVVGNNNQEVISIANPAFLANLKLTSFSLAFKSQGSDVQTEETEFSSGAVSISNLSLGIPLGRKGGFALGLRTHSAVGYEVSSDDFFNEGSGGVNQVYVGLGYQVLKGLSVGAQFNQYFGKADKRKAIKSVTQPSVEDYSYNVKGNTIKLGVQYKYPLSKKIEAQAGAYGVLGHDITASGTREFYSAIQTEENVFSRTVNSNNQTENIKGTEKNSFKSVFGIGLGEDNHWFAGLSYENKEALKYSGDVFLETTQINYTASNDVLKVGYEASNKINFGGYIIPKKYALKNYLKRVAYRAGLKYEKTGLVLNNNSVKNLGMSFGLGLPVGRRVSYLNISLELGRIGEFSKNKYQEEYFNLGVNISLSDKWFQKRVID